MTLPLKAISVRQPWAWAIIYAGKDVGNRRRAALVNLQRAVGQWVCIHTSQTVPARRPMTEAVEFMPSLGVDYPAPDALDYGGLIGTVVIRDVIYTDRRGRPMLVNGERVMRSKWFNGDAGSEQGDDPSCRGVETKPPVDS
jgi:hypothetical protein